MNGNAIFSGLLLSSKPRDKKQHCHLRFADVLLLKKDSEESIASIFSQKKMVLPARMNFFPRCLRIDAAFSLQELILRR